MNGLKKIHPSIKKYMKKEFFSIFITHICIPPICVGFICYVVDAHISVGIKFGLALGIFVLGMRIIFGRI